MTDIHKARVRAFAGLFIAVWFLAGLWVPSGAEAGILEAARERGQVVCGVSETRDGLSVVDNDGPQTVIVRGRIDAIVDDLGQQRPLDRLLLVGADRAPLLEQLVELCRGRQARRVKGGGGHAVPGQRLCRADGDALRAGAAILDVDDRLLVDQRDTALVADLGAQTTSGACLSVYLDHFPSKALSKTFGTSEDKDSFVDLWLFRVRVYEIS